VTQSQGCRVLAQELHYRASVHVASLLCAGEGDRQALLTAAAPLTDARTEGARRKAAAAVLSRLGLGRRRQVEARGLHRLLAELAEPAGRQLLAYVVATREPLLGGLVSEVLYPYLLERKTPPGMSTEEFSAANANGLFEVAGAITHSAVAEYARRRWGIEDRSATRRALRALRKGGILGAAWMSRPGGRCYGYFPIIGLPDIACFAYALYAIHGDAGRVRLDRLRAGLFVRLFMLRPIAVDYLLERTRRLRLIVDARSEIARLPYRTLDDAVESILHAHRMER
jgi:hypothetical protein